jgi:RND family efflux transporter MFP subunit
MTAADVRGASVEGLMRQWASWLMFGLAAALVLGCGHMRRRAEEDQPEQDAGMPVIVAPARREAMTQTVTVTGTIRAGREADITAQVSARVLEVKAREGDRVAEGQVLVTLDRAQSETKVQRARAGVEAARARLEAAERRLEIIEEGAREEELAIARSQVEQAESALRTAEADLQRLKGLFDQGAVSRQQLDVAQTAYDTARTSRDAARRSLDLLEKGAREEEKEAARKDVEAAAAGLAQAEATLAEEEEYLGYTVIRSPLTGVVYERDVEPGEIAMPGGDPLLRVVDYSSVYYEAAVPERVAMQVKPGQRVNVAVQGDGERAVGGEVERLVPVANPQSRDFLLRVSIVENAPVTKPGMFARGAVVVDERANAVVVPKEALVERGGQMLAFVVEEGTARQRAVEVGLANRVNVEIVSGISPGENVVVVGGQGLKDGDPVRLQESGGS